MKVNLEWQDVNFGETGYNVYKSSSPMDPQNLPTPLASLGAEVLNYEDTAVTDDTTYYYRVSTLVGGVEYVSPEIEILVDDALAPYEGGGELLINETISINRAIGEVVLTWEEVEPTGTMYINIYRDTSPIDTSNLPAPVHTISGGGVYTYTDTTPDDTSNYFYVIELIAGSKSYFSDNLKAFYAPTGFGLVAHYKLESNAGSVLVDETGNYNGTIYGTTSVVTGKDGQALSMDADGSHASTGLDEEIGSLLANADNEWAISFWFKGGPQTDEDGVVVGRGGGTGTKATFAALISKNGGNGNAARAGDQLVFDIRGAYTDTLANVTDDEWHFGLATWDGQGGVVRVDNTEFTMNAGFESLQTGNFLAIGSHRGEDSPEDGAPVGYYTYDGAVDQVRPYNRYLSKYERGLLANEFGVFFDFAAFYSFENTEVNLNWSEVNSKNLVDVIIYRDTSPIDTGALPASLTTVNPGVESYTDTTISQNQTYYYLIDVRTTGPTSNYSEGLEVSTAEGLNALEGKGPMVWYEPSDLSTLFQDTAGNTPVTADGQTVQRINDKSSNAYDAVIDTGTCTYRTDGTYHWLEFSACRFKFPQFISGTQDRTFAAGVHVNGNNNYSLMDLQTNSSVSDGADWTPSLESGNWWIRVAGGNATFSDSAAYQTDHLIYMDWGISYGTNVFDTRVFRDSVSKSRSSGNSATIDTDVTTNSTLGGSFRQSESKFSGRFYSFFLSRALMDASEQQIIEDYINTKMP